VLERLYVDEMTAEDIRRAASGVLLLLAWHEADRQETYEAGGEDQSPPAITEDSDALHRQNPA
jgi:hypothetical protein